MSDDKILYINQIEYHIGEYLGGGGYGECRLLISEYDKNKYVAKRIKKIDIIEKENKNAPEKEIVEEKKNLNSEIEIHQKLNKLNNPNIVKYITSFETKDYVYLILEYCENNDLQKLLNERTNLKEIEVQCYLIQLINALQGLKSEGIIHRDLKPGNIFLTEKMELKLGDYGFAKEKKELDKIQTKEVGTLHYMAPEIYEGIYSFASDIWALGIIIYQLIYGKLPFNLDKKNKKENYHKLKDKDYTFIDDIKASECAKDLIKQILEPDLEKRPSLDSILTHDFFKLGKIPKLLPSSTKENPPPLYYIREFMPDADEDGIVNKPCTTTNLKKIEEDMEKINLNDMKKDEAENLIGAEIWTIGNYNYDNHCCYLLNNGYYGVLFKNKTLLYNPDKDLYVIYIDEKGKETKGYVSKLSKDLQAEFNKFDSLKNKIFKNNNLIDKKKKNITNIYLDDYKEFENTKFFWFNNKDRQVCFKDGTEILYSKLNKVFTYVNSNRQRINYSIESVKNKAIKYNEFNERFNNMIELLKKMDNN